MVGRRDFLHCSLCASGAWLLGCGSDPAPMDAGTDTGVRDATPPDAGGGCEDAFAGGTMLSLVPFVGEDIPLGTRRGQGWDGRLYADLSGVDSSERVIGNDDFYLRTFYPDLLVPPDPWTIAVEGLVDAPSALSIETIRGLAEPQGAHVLECSGNGRRGAFGLMSAAEWTGAPMGAVLDRLTIQPRATRVLVEGFDMHSVPSVGGHSTPGASWIFTFDELNRAGAFLATEMNGAPLPADHGAPVRLYVPGWYGCSCIKWVNRIALVDEDEPATSQMMEFASRTHQSGTPALARDYRPAAMQQAAMPIRVEKWRDRDGQLVYRVMGILWGGEAPTDRLVFAPGLDQFPVEVCPPMTQNQTWTTWQTAWRPEATGEHILRMEIDDPSIPTIRLDANYYARQLVVDEV